MDRRTYRGAWLLLSSSLGSLFMAPGARADSQDVPDAGSSAPPYIGAPATPKRLSKKDVPRHPGLAAQSSIHVDLYNSDATDLATPLGREPIVTRGRYGDLIGTCLNLVFDHSSRLFAFCGELRGGNIAFQLTALDPDTLDKRAKFDLLEFTLQELLELPLDLGYMVFDDRERFIAINRDNHVLWVGLDGAGSSAQFRVEQTLDLSQYVPVTRDKVASVVPDYDGHLAYMTLGKADDAGSVTVPALFGVIDPRTGSHVQRELTGEIIENGLAVGRDGIFVLTDRALYGFQYLPDTCTLRELFRQPYTRATRPKPGVISFGSGATPTLIGDDLVAITDNADDQIHLLVYDRRATPRAPGRVVCDVPLFDPGASANENSVLSAGRSIVVQNWYGAPDSFISGTHRSIVPGLMRIDVRPDRSGCDVIWHTRELATPATLKISTATGLLHGAMLEPSIVNEDAFYAVNIDFETGRIQNRILLGTGRDYDIQLSPTYIGPGGAIYQPVRTGLVKVEDGPARTGAKERSWDCSIAPTAPRAAWLGLGLGLLALGFRRARRAL